MTTKAQQADREKAVTQLREWLRPGDRVYTILRHRSRSGMFRRIGLTAPDHDRPTEMMYLDGMAAKALGLNLSRDKEGLPVSGCGMDMGFHLVYELSSVLWPNGYVCHGAECHSNDHSNGDRNRRPHHHSDGGYALRHRWL